MRHRITRRRLLAAVLLVATLATTVAGVLRLRVETTLDSFLPRGDPAVTALADNARSFGGDPIVAVLESSAPRGLLLGQGQLSALMRLEGTLAHLPDVAAVYGPATIMNQIAITSQDMIARLSGTRDGLRARAEDDARGKGLSAAAVKAAGEAAVGDFDRRYGGLLVRGLPAGLPTTSNPNFVQNVIYDGAGQPRARWHFVVPTANSVTVLVRPREGLDETATRRLVSAVRNAVSAAGLATSRTTVTGVPVITSAVTDEATGEIPLIGGLALVVLLLRFLLASRAQSWWRKLWPLTAAVTGSALTLAAFGWAGLPVSFGAIMLLPLLLGIGSSFPLYLGAVADRRKVVVVSLASAAAFGSLAISPLPFVRELGLALALGVLLTVAVTLVLGHKMAPPPRVRTQGAAPGALRWVVVVCLVVLAAAGWVALPRLDVRASPEDVASGLPALAQARYAEQVLGSSGQVSVVLRGTDTQSPDALRWLTQAQDAAVARFGDQLRPVLTAPDLLGFLGDQPTAQQISAGMQLLPPYLTTAVFSPDGRQALLSFGLKFQDLGAQAQLLRDLRAALPPPPAGDQVDTVGLPVAAVHAYDQVSRDRYPANLTGIAAAGLVLLAGLRRRSDAWRAMLAAALATGWMIAGLWALGQSLSPLTVALGSLASVTACEFTILLLDGARARRVAMWACATSAIGYLALVPSRIGLLREFGLTLAATVLLSYLAALAVARSGQRRKSRPAARTALPEAELVEV
ncbi:MMPL family transporter [Amycolatopsis sp. K13G38]|uniref:MMPL family transporter n=1 Tax=Amycolatopsis acididurans TaxID=2724524 RepID=A0ABX1JAP4_9PSEU|nr:MMPL family transporter [Amycolatopsis acididurans]NKQ55486.1 MMPL family transporter [Amycolatopsis acididurans]